MDELDLSNSVSVLEVDRGIQSLVALVEVEIPSDFLDYLRNLHADPAMAPKCTSEMLVRGPGGRAGYCTGACFLVSRAAKDAGGATCNVTSWATSRVGQLISELTKDDQRQPDKHTFRHDCSIIMLGERIYLVDLTVGQFVRKDGAIGSRWYGLKTASDSVLNGRMIEEFPVLQNLMRYGYVELTAETLREYLGALTLDQSERFRNFLEVAVTENAVRDLVVKHRNRDPWSYS